MAEGEPSWPLGKYVRVYAKCTCIPSPFVCRVTIEILLPEPVPCNGPPAELQSEYVGSVWTFRCHVFCNGIAASFVYCNKDWSFHGAFPLLIGFMTESVCGEMFG